jgi:hypothetical protein
MNYQHRLIQSLPLTRVNKIFFLIMFVSTVNTRKRYEFCNFRHSQWWILKAAIIFIGYGFATYAPSSLLQFYGQFLLHYSLQWNLLQLPNTVADFYMFF